MLTTQLVWDRLDTFRKRNCIKMKAIIRLIFQRINERSGKAILLSVITEPHNLFCAMCYLYDFLSYTNITNTHTYGILQQPIRVQADDNTVDIITLHFGLSCWTSYVFTREYQEAPHMCIILQ